MCSSDLELRGVRARRPHDRQSRLGLLFCVGCWTEMGGSSNVLRGIRHFGPQGRIAYVHFRDVKGRADKFAECFIGEGDLDATAVMRALKEVGFSGPIIDDHAPRMIGDEGWSFRARGYQTGYLQGLLRAVEDLDGGTSNGVTVSGRPRW